MNAPAFTIRAESPDQPELRALIDALDDYQRRLYPAESNHLLDIASLMRPEVAFAVARDGEGQALGIGAVVCAGDGTAELKRMYVPPPLRGRGIAKALLAWLQAQAQCQGCTALRLETGIHQPEALALYERMGFRRRGPFATYTEDPLSVFMEKALVRIERVRLPVDESLLEGLAQLLQACVHAGASIGFVQPFGLDDARAFWRGPLQAVSQGQRAMLVARDSDGAVVGTVHLVLDMPPNGRHRAELVKLMVHPLARRQGLARALMLAAEQLAREHARQLLVLDTRSGDVAEALYRGLGWQVVGRIPDYARAVDSDRLDSTTVMYKRLS